MRLHSFRPASAGSDDATNETMAAGRPSSVRCQYRVSREPARRGSFGGKVVASGADLTFASLLAEMFDANVKSKAPLASIKLASGPLTPTFANVAPRWGANVGVGPLTSGRRRPVNPEQPVLFQHGKAKGA